MAERFKISVDAGLWTFTFKMFEPVGEEWKLEGEGAIRRDSYSVFSVVGLQSRGKGNDDIVKKVLAGMISYIFEYFRECALVVAEVDDGQYGNSHRTAGCFKSLGFEECASCYGNDTLVLKRNDFKKPDYQPELIYDC